MGSPNGGIIGVINPSSFGKCTQTVTTSSGPLTTQPGTRLVATAVVLIKAFHIKSPVQGLKLATSGIVL